MMLVGTGRTSQVHVLDPKALAANGQAAWRFFGEAALDLRAGFFSTAVTRATSFSDTGQNASALPSGQPASVHMW